MTTRSSGLSCALLLLLTTLLGCDWAGTWPEPTFDLWCGKQLCGWQTDRGDTKRISTWHNEEYALSLVGDDVQVSYLSDAAPVHCMPLMLTADVGNEAQLSLLLDFNDDGEIEYEQAITTDGWLSRYVPVFPPADYKNVRYILRKTGKGHAAFARFRLETVWTRCRADTERVLIQANSVCTTDASCASGLCALGRCSECGASSEMPEESTQAEPFMCEEGAECASDEQCEVGICSGGLCQSCTLDGSCPAFARCDSDEQCQSGACLPRLSFSDVQEATACLRCSSDIECGGKCVKGACETCSLDPYPKQCAECASDAQCESGHCTFGVCSSCVDDAQCGEGERCRFTDRFDVGKRECTSDLPKSLPRAALCEADAECEKGLTCGAGKGEPKRCGIACELAPRVCGAKQICTRPGLSEIEGFVRYPQYALAAFAETEGRIATCHDRLWDEDAQSKVACTFHAECSPGACCDGVCVASEVATPDYRTGGCGPALPSWYVE